MARQSDTARESAAAVREIAREIVEEDPDALHSPTLAHQVVTRLRARRPSVIAYMNRHRGGAHAEVSAILDLSFRESLRRR